MKLFHLLQAYESDEIMPVINDIFPGTNELRLQLKVAYDTLPTMKPMSNSKVICYRVMSGGKPDYSYVGAEDSYFSATWEVCLGKDVSCGQGVDLNDAELLASALASPYLQAKYPEESESVYQKLMRG